MYRCLSILFLSVTLPAAAQVLAFPGAQGFGAYAKGGRGGDVYHVTNLSNRNTDAGSFSYGLTNVPAAGRTIVFDVSGYAHVSGTVRITNNKITIAGQTAPGDGFALKDGTFLVSGDDIIIRHLRVRDGNSGDAVNLDSNSVNCIFDHSEAMFGNDENMSTFGSAPENLTFQWGFNAWGMESHSCGGLWDMSHTTCAYSLWAHNHTRNPKARPGILEWINNVTFDWDIGFIMGDSQTNANWTSNVRGCYFIGPPGNTQSKAFVKGTVGTNGRPNFTLFMDNCWTDIDGDGVLNGFDRGYGIVEGSSYTNGQLPAPAAGDKRYYQAAAPLTGSTAPMTIDPPLLAYKKIVSNAGPLRLDYDPAIPLRDEVANLLVTNLETQRRYHVNAVAKTGLAYGGFGNMNSTPAPIDTDQDGIPDFYETAVTRTGDVWTSTVDDHNTACANSGGVVSEPTHFPANTPVGSAAADKYTHLEEYLHFLSVPHAVMAKSTVSVTSFIDIDLRKFTRGFVKSPVFTVSNVLNGMAALQPNGYTVRFTAPTANFTGLPNPFGRAKFDFNVLDADGSTWTQRFDILVSSSALPRILTWQGATNAWDTSSQNWLFKSGATFYVDPDNVTFGDSGSNTNISIGANVAPSAVNINSTKDYAFSGAAIIGSTALRKFGTGTLTLANANTYSGGTVVDGSTLILNPGATLASPLTLQNNAAFTNNSGGTTIPGLVVPTGSSATFNSGTGMTLATGSAVTGGGSLNFNVQNGVAFKASAGTFTGPINFVGAGTVTLYSNGGSFGGFDLAALDIGGSVTLSPRTNSGGNTLAIGSLSGSSATAVLGGGSAGSPIFNIGSLNLNTTFAGSIGGNAIVNKNGTGTLTLTGASTYTGATGLNAGTLIVNGSLGATGVTLASGTTLAGTGNLGGLVTVASGGKLTPGNLGAAGTITSNALTIGTGSLVQFDVSSNPAAGNDRIVLSGGKLTSTGTPTLQFNLVDDVLGAGTYPVISGGSATSNTPAFLTNLPSGARQTLLLQTPSAGNLNLVVTGTAATLTWLGSPTNIWDTNSTVNWTGAPEVVPNNKFLTFDAVAFNDTDANGGIPNGNVTVKGIVSPRSLTVTNSALNYSFTGGSISGGGALIKNGPGTLTLASSVLVLSSTTTVGKAVTVDTTNLLAGMTVTGSGIPAGTTIASISNATTLQLSIAATAAATVNLSYFFANTYTGGTFINGGAIVLADETTNFYALGSGPITFNGGALTMYSDFGSYTANNYNFVVPVGAAGTLNTDSRSDLNGSLTGGGTLNYVTTANRTTLYGDWSAFTGVVNVSGGGEFRYGTSYGYGGFPQAAIALGANDWMYYVGTLSGGAGTTISIGELSGAASARVLGGATTGRALTLRVGSRNTDATFAGTIAEQGTSGNTTSYVKTGAGTWTLSGTCNYNGGTTVEQGTLCVTGFLTSPQAVNVLAGATLYMQNGTITVDAVNIAAGAFFIGNGTINGDFNNDGTVSSVLGGTLTVTGDVVNNGVMRIASGTALVATGQFVNNGILDLLTGTQGLPANLENNGIVIDSSSLVASGVSKAGDVVTVTVPTHSGHSYQMQRSLLLGSEWTDVGTPQNGLTTALGAPTERTFTDPAATEQRCFYRVRVDP